jgi:hypothetical protein
MPVTVKRVRIDPWLVRSTVILIWFVRSETKSLIEVSISWKITRMVRASVRNLGTDGNFMLIYCRM